MRVILNRETTEDGKNLLFDHGAPYFSVTNPAVLDVVHEWESRGLAAEWKERFGSYDCFSNKFIDHDEESSRRRFVGIPGMNSICKGLCNDPGIENKFGVGVGKLEWMADQNLWSLISLDGQFLGNFGGLIATDKLLAASGFAHLKGVPPPIDMNVAPQIASRMKDLPARPCFALMLAFAEPLQSIPMKGFSFINSEILRSASCDSSKPGRPSSSECWVLYSTAEYAKKVIDECDAGLKKPSIATLTRVAEELLQAFRSTGLCTSQPYFMRAHRWGSAFPAVSIAKEEKCLWDASKRMGVCGDFCVSPSVEGAIESGLAAALKLIEMFVPHNNQNTGTKL
ncbi:hypothetical protein KSS87_018954 [Heliosperma pusillum]|nr:hypothetical protein KSS87_018954 [Heliosperma pusillum]